MYNMELKLTELDSMNPYDTFDYNSYEEQNGSNYWEKPKVEEKQPKKKKVSFNDILSNMNLVVNKQGVLQFMAPTQEEEYNPFYQNNPNYNPSYQNISQSKQSVYQQPIRNSEPLDASVKHSYIYNKYFKDYNDPNIQNPGPRIPKTIEEYREMLLDDRKRAIEHKLRMENIKSKKMMFTTGSGSNSNSNPRNIIASRNNLKSMNFR